MTKQRANNRQQARMPGRQEQSLVRTAFPRSTVVKLRYVADVQLTPTTSAVGSYIFRANNLYDPDYSGTGHQPMGFRQWAAFYNHYVVQKSTILAEMTTLAGAEMVFAGIHLADDAFFNVNQTTMIEQGLSNTVTFTGHSGAQRVTRIRKNYNAKTFFNVTDIKDNVARIGANTSGGPTEEAYFIVYVGDVNSTSTANTPFQALITMEFDVIFSEPKELPSS
jgi:hypothetical protein